jgi:CRISPR-associated protein Cmr2
MKYVGITIGPIFDTVNEATRPAALWFASTMFSDITRRLCININERFGLQTTTGDATKEYPQIYSPFYNKEDSAGLEDGIGKYHDRIIFSTDKEDYEDIEKTLDETISQVKKETADIFGNEFFESEDEKQEAVGFFENYLMIEYVILDEEKIKGKSCLLAISPYLDDLEIMYFSPNRNENSPIKKLFGGEKDDPNKLIKQSALFGGLSDDGVKNICEPCKGGAKIEKKDRVIKSIEYIAGRKTSEYKRTNYFAVVSADGDKMGKFLETINDNSSVTKFSEACLNYDKTAADEVVKFGGMPIYAGGDDLLFLAPVVSESGETVLSLCSRINKEFKKKIEDVKEFKGNDKIPTISFGISIQYYKYPLYEALNRARGQLYVAKDVEEGKEKNRTSVILEKHSGQTVSFVIGNEHIASTEEKKSESIVFFEDFLKYIIEKDKNKVANEEFILQSLGSKLELHKVIVAEIEKNLKNSVEPVGSTNHYPWDNLFDNEGQQNVNEYLQEIQKWYYNEVKKKGNSWRVETKGETTFLQAALRMGKFLIERGQD